MWRRSEVEQLTGLGRHTIQDLCNQNTSRDGLGFWEPAVMKPGYSRFDEGDLLAFYLVRQLTKIGFTPAELGPVVLSLTEKNNEFVGFLRERAHVLSARRATLDEQLAGLERLEEAATSSVPEQRLYALMGCELAASARRAADAAAHELHVSTAQREQVELRLGEIARSLTAAVRDGRGQIGEHDIEEMLASLSEEGGRWGAGASRPSARALPKRGGKRRACGACPGQRVVCTSEATCGCGGKNDGIVRRRT